MTQPDDAAMLAELRECLSECGEGLYLPKDHGARLLDLAERGLALEASVKRHASVIHHLEDRREELRQRVAELEARGTCIRSCGWCEACDPID